MKRLFALVVLLLMSGSPAFAAAPPHHGAAHVPARQPTAKPPVSVTVSSVTPNYVTRSAQTVRVSGQVRNDSGNAYPRLTIRLAYSTRSITSRGELDAFAEDKTSEPPLPGPAVTLRAPLAPGGRQKWSLALPAKLLGLRSFGVYVYPISVQALNAGALVGRQRTFVTYCPKGAGIQKTKLSWIWPVIDQPHRADDSTFVDDRLERSFSSGRLEHLVTTASRARAPITWLVDPSLVDDAAHMAAKDGYTIKGTAHRSHSVAARAWLDQLRAAVAGKRLIATPYADPDVMALAHAGMSGDVKSATAAASRALGPAGLGGATTSVAVPPDGLADQRTLAALAAAGSRTVVLSSAVLPDPQARTYTPDPVSRRKVSGDRVSLIAYDDTISDALQTADEPGDAALTEQRFLAETAMITGEMPHHSRSVVVMPPRRWDPDPALAKRLLTDSAHVPWLHAVPLKKVEALRPVDRVLQPQKHSSGLPKHYLRQVKDLSGRIHRFTSIFRSPVSGFALGIARLESSAWSDRTPRGAALRDTLDDELTDAIGKIKVLNNEVTLAGRSGQIPLTIANELDEGTVVVQLHAYSQNDTRLHLEGTDHTLTLQAGHKDTVILYGKAAANGPAYVTLELRTPDGHALGDTQVLQVRATAYGRTALLITGISLAVLFLGVGIRVVRRRGDGAEESIG